MIKYLIERFEKKRREKHIKIAIVKAIEFQKKSKELLGTICDSTPDIERHTAIMLCKIEKNYESHIHNISKNCHIKYEKPEPFLLYGLIVEEIKKLYDI